VIGLPPRAWRRAVHQLADPAANDTDLVETVTFFLDQVDIIDDRTA
jgi:hypothetical protein